MLFQIWEDEEVGCISLSQKESEDSLTYKMLRILYHFGVNDDKVVLIAEYDARTHLEALQRRNEIMGWGDYYALTLENGDIDPVYLEDLDKQEVT